MKQGDRVVTETGFEGVVVLVDDEGFVLVSFFDGDDEELFAPEFLTLVEEAK